MTSHYRYTRRWLERRYNSTDAAGTYLAHMPIWGYGTGPAEICHLPRIARTAQILSHLATLEPGTLLDVGAGEGWLAVLARDSLGFDAVASDIAAAASRRANELFGLPSLACDAEFLPFADDSFDVVVCSEVLEHVEFPIHVLLELSRVARRAVVLSTEELTPNRQAIETFLEQRCGYPHSERNKFHPSDLRAMYGNVELWPQYTNDSPGDDASRDEGRDWLLRTVPESPDAPGGGVVLRALQGATQAIAPRKSREQLIDEVLDFAVAPVQLEDLKERLTRRPLPVAPVCPLDRTPLEEVDGELVAPSGRRYDARELPILNVRDEHTPTREALAEQLSAALPGQRRRHQHLLELNDRLVLTEDPSRTVWELREPTARRGWRATQDLAPRAGEGAWPLTCTGGDPALVTPTMPFRIEAIEGFEITMRLHNEAFGRDAGHGQIYWITDDETTFTEANSLRFDVINDDTERTYRIRPADAPGWPTSGDLVCLRIDPVNGPCALDFVRFHVSLRS